MSSNNLNFWRRNWILRTIITVKSWMIKQQAMRNIVNSCHPQSHRDSVKKFSKNSRRFTTLFKRSMRCLMSLATTAVTVASTMLKLSMSSDDLDWEYTISPSPRIHYCYRWPYQDLFVLRSGHIDPLMLFISVTTALGPRQIAENHFVFYLGDVL